MTADGLLKCLAKVANPTISDQELLRRGEELKTDLHTAIGDRDQTNDRVDERIARYLRLAERAEYGDQPLPEYDADLWFDEAVNEQVRGLRDRSDLSLTRYDPLTDIYTWKDQASYTTTHWYRFQEAVKAHQATAWEILAERNFHGLQLPEW